MNIFMKYKESVTIEVSWKYLHVIYALLALIKQFTAKDNTNFFRIYSVVEADLRKKIIQEAEAKSFQLCERCFKEIDTRTERYHHQVFESGYEQYWHIECPPINKGKGYEND